MNDILDKFARDYLKVNLAKCTEDQQNIFRLMYGENGPKYELTIDHVIDEMPSEKLDWAMEQVKRTVEKNIGISG